MKYKNKETQELERIENIKREYNELLGNTNEFEEYRDNFNKFLLDYYDLIEEE
jgi:hypothetical protein